MERWGRLLTAAEVVVLHEMPLVKSWCRVCIDFPFPPAASPPFWETNEPSSAAPQLTELRGWTQTVTPEAVVADSRRRLTGASTSISHQEMALCRMQ